MNQEQIKLVQESFEKIVPIAGVMKAAQAEATQTETVALAR